jgi:hypothetical protein
MGSGTPGTVNTSTLVKLSFDKQVTGDVLLFHSFTPPSLQLQNVQHNTWTVDGKLTPNNGSGRTPLQGDWSLERVLDNQGALYEWFDKVQQTGRIKDNEATATVEIHDSKDQPIGTWTLGGTTPISYQQAALDANGNGIMTESVTFHSTDIKWTKGSGGASTQ